MRGKVHAGKAQYAYSYVRTCVTAQVRRTLMHTKRIRSKRWKQAVNCGTATHATRDGIATRTPMRGKANAGKKNHTRTHMCYTCAHAYVRACVYTYAYTHVHMCACTHMSTHMFSHVSLPTQRSLLVAAIPSRVAVPWFAACTYARGMYPCAHVRTNEYAYDVFPA